MVQQFLNHIHDNQLCKTTDKILLAVSGGVDSMVMLELFRKASFDIGVAHCNFQLRGDEADADEALVKETCEKLDLPFHIARFETLRFAREGGISVQMAARDLRYSFFHDVAEKNQYHCIATAHHLNDSLETTLLNFVRGSGIEGLAGVPVRSEKIIRPMLFATQEAIRQFAIDNALLWREDQSNQTNDYQRNFLRNELIPELKRINPSLEETFRNTNERLRGTAVLVKRYLEGFEKKSVRSGDDEIRIERRDVLDHQYPAVLLWELIKQKGFNFEQCKEAVEISQAGKKISSQAYDLFIDRGEFIVVRHTDQKPGEVLVSLPLSTVENDIGQLHFVEQPVGDFLIDADPCIAALDWERLTFPMVWRTWKSGDSFMPLGMQQRKKLSDFLIDQKIALPDKRNVTVLESDGEIVWVVGYRISDRYKVGPTTTRVLNIRFRIGH